MRGEAVDKDPGCETAVARKGLVREVRFASNVGRERKCAAPRGAVQLEDLGGFGRGGLGQKQRWGAAEGKVVVSFRG